MTQTEIIDLDALVRPVRVKINGAEHDIFPVNAVATKLSQSMTEDNRIDVMVKVAAIVVPSLTEDALATLPLETLNTILRIAAQGLAAVQALDPNGTRPAEADVLSPSPA